MQRMVFRTENVKAYKTASVWTSKDALQLEEAKMLCKPEKKKTT